MNRKGFTMVELLASVAILGILSGLAITGVSAILNKAHEEYYNSERKNLVLAAQAYYNANKTKLPKVIGKKEQVTAKELKDSNYLKSDITTYDKKEVCDESYVRVFKYGQSEYSYTAYLICEGNTDVYNDPNDEGPTFEAPVIEGQKNVALSAIKLKMHGGTQAAPLKLISYSYVISIVKGDKNVELINSGNKAYSSTVLEKNLSLSKYTLGKETKMIVKMRATNINGNTKAKSYLVNFEDNDRPKCILREDKKDTPDTTEGKKNWVNDKRTITIECDDGDGSGCEKKSYTKTFTKDNIVDTIKIKDNAGNSKDCEVTTYIDKTKPVVEAKAYKCKAGKTEADTSKLVDTKKFTADGTWSSSEFDNHVNGWLNNANYPDGICFVFSVTDNLALKSTSWKWNTAGLAKNATNYKKLTGGPTAENGINDGQFVTKDFINSKTYKYSLTAEGHRYAEFNVVDDKGNSTTIKMDIKIDRTAPNKPSTVLRKWSNNNTKPDTLAKAQALTGRYTSGDWSGKKIASYPSTVTDAISGGVYYQYTTTGKTENKTDQKATYRNIAAEGTSTIKWRSFDEAGNTKGYNSALTTKIDLTAPTCTTTKVVSHDPDGVDATFKCTDSLSGVKTCHGKVTKLTTGGKSSKEHSYAIYDNVNNKGTCKVTVTRYNQHNLRTCSTCKRCSSAACEVWNYVTKSSCSYSVKTVAKCHGSPNNGSEYYPVPASKCGMTGTNTDASMCCCHASYWKEKSTCKTRARNCSKCGCSSWNNWKGWRDDAYSCSGYCDTKTRYAYK